jgi:hypothetical protein
LNGSRNHIWRCALHGIWDENQPHDERREPRSKEKAGERRKWRLRRIIKDSRKIRTLGSRTVKQMVPRGTIITKYPHTTWKISRLVTQSHTYTASSKQLSVANPLWRAGKSMQIDHKGSNTSVIDLHLKDVSRWCSLTAVRRTIETWTGRRTACSLRQCIHIEMLVRLRV